MPVVVKFNPIIHFHHVFVQAITRPARDAQRWYPQATDVWKCAREGPITTLEPAGAVRDLWPRLIPAIEADFINVQKKWEEVMKGR